MKNEPQDILIEFMIEMHQWEVDAKKLADEKGILNVRDEVRDKLAGIYEKFLSKPGGKTGKLSGPSVRFPPEYNEKFEDIQNVDISESKKAIISTLWRHPVIPDFSRQQKYTLVLKNDEWKISKKEVFRATSEKWENLVF